MIDRPIVTFARRLGSRTVLPAHLPSWAGISSLAALTFALAARAWFRIDYAEDGDALGFLLALDRFDVAADQPYFPGYPVFVVLGRVLMLVSGDPVSALATLCATAGGLLTVPVAALAHETLGPREARWAAWLVAVNPVLWLHAEMLLSEMPGLLFLFAGLAVFARGLLRDQVGATNLGCFLLGLTLGIRFSYFPFALSALALVLRRRPAHAAFIALAAGCLVWGVPFVAVSDWRGLVEAARVPEAGDLVRWVGAVRTPDLARRATSLVWGLTAEGLATWWPDRSVLYVVPTLGLVAATALGLAVGRTKARAAGGCRFWGVIVTPYAVWVFFGQNFTLAVRQVLPLVVLLVLVVAWALARAIEDGHPLVHAYALLAAPLILAGQATSGLMLAREHRDVPSSVVRLARQLEDICRSRAGNTVVYTATLERHLRREAPCVLAVKVEGLSEATSDLARRGPDTEAFVFSDVRYGHKIAAAPFAHAVRNRYIQTEPAELSVYRFAHGSGLPE